MIHNVFSYQTSHMPKKSLIFIISIGLGLVTGCGGGDSDLGIPAPPPQSGSVSASATVDVTAPNTPAPAGTVAPPAATPSIDFAAVKRPLDAQGNPLNDLDFLNHLVHQANESRLAKGSDIPMKDSFKTEAEQMAYEEAQRKRFEPISDLNDLVKDGFIKALPTAPAGQKFALDPATKKVILTAQ